MDEDKVRTQLRRIFVEHFTAALIAEPLVSFDAEKPAAAARAFMEQRGFDCVGVRRGGVVAGFALAAELDRGALGDSLRPIGGADGVPESAGFFDVIGRLAARGRCFVSALGGVCGIVTWHDLQKPPVRMWLFGQITILEMALVRAVRVIYASDSWQEHLSPARIEQARRLQAERARQGQPADLLDCLQLSDKAQILIRDPGARAKLGVASATRAKRNFRDIAALRNNLAHSQGVLMPDWGKVVERFERLEDLVQKVLELEAERAGRAASGGGAGADDGEGLR